MDKRLISLLGLAQRARRLCYGETVIESIRSKKVYLVLVAADASEKTRKKITDKGRSYQVPVCVAGTVAELSAAVGQSNRVCIGVLDEGFAKKISQLMK